MISRAPCSRRSFRRTRQSSTYTRLHASLPSIELAGTGKPSTAGFDRLRRQLVHVSRERVVYRSRQNHRHGFLFRVHVDNSCRRRWCVWELAKITRHQKRWYHYFWRPPHSKKLRPCSCVLRVSVYRAYWKMLGGLGVCGLECCLGPNLQGMTSQFGGIGLIS